MSEEGCYQKNIKQAGAELGQAQVKLEVIYEVEIVVEVEVQLLLRVGGWVDGGLVDTTKLM